MQIIPMAEGKIKSVLDKSTEIRNKSILSNRGKYTVYDDVNPISNVGEAFSVSDNFKTESITEGKDLYEYTHDGKSGLSQVIRKRYDLGRAYRGSDADSNRMSYNVYRPNGRGYLDYLDYVYGYGNFNTNYVNRLLTFLGNGVAEEEGRVGVIDHIDVESALNGFITTNPNIATLNTVADVATMLGNKWWEGTDISTFTEDNPEDMMKSLRLAFAKTDTRLGVISNMTYAKALKKDAIVSTGRRDYRVRNGLIPALTPSTLNEYGNNMMTVTSLGDMMRVGASGRAYLFNGPGGNVKIKHEISSEELHDGITDNAGAATLIGYLNADGHPLNDGDFTPRDVYYSPVGGKGYVSFSRTEEGHEDFFYYDKKINTVQNLGFEWKQNGDKSNSESGRGKYILSTDHFQYDEDGHLDGKDVNDPNDGYEYLYHTDLYNDNRKDLLSITKDLFAHRKMRGMASFYKEVEAKDRSGLDSAYIEEYGNSRGRNLLKKNTDEPNGYKNPYCRVWTYHHQYDRFSRGIRPFMKDDKNAYDVEEIQSLVKEYRAKGGSTYTNGAKFLAENSVLQKNGLVRIAPHWDIDIEKEEIKKCMFSIENLAWKDVDFTNSENLPATKGPNGGRIMWFPPYGLNLNESVSVDWDRRTFIGRGEKVFTYSNTDRELRIDFVLLVDHPSIIDKRVKYATNKNTGDYKYNGSEDDTDLLRFIAGCGIFDELKTKGGEEKEPAVVNVTEGNGLPEEVNTEHFKEGESGKNKITFAVFFPNNYSGLYDAANLGDDAKSREESFKKSGGTDTMFLLLLRANNAVWGRNDSIGYEVDDEKGVSTGDADEGHIIRACDVPYSLKADFNVCDESLEDDDRYGEFKKFHYPVDFDLRQAYLKIETEKELGDEGFDSSYYDTRSFGFNSNVKSVINNTNNNFSNNTCSFVDFVNATSSGWTDTDGYYAGLRKKGDAEKAKQIREILRDHRITKIEVIGGATNQDSKNSVALAKRRARNTAQVVKKYLDAFRRGSGSALNDMDNVEIEYNSIFTNFYNGGENIAKSDTINSNVAKYQRCAQVHIYYDNADTEVVGSEEGMDGENGLNYTVNVVSYQSQPSLMRKNVPEATEYEYFKSIKEDDPVIYKTITNKFKRFDPAFHSITPEGFNARLSFLHQCTRQGHTISASENKGTYGTAPTAGNLAFGRMPVCVIRIGDFINSRMVINSMSVSYSDDGTQWDLNPEGIGVQPIFAKVTLNTNLIGGSSLNGPVNRLQNAQTFDYYANTGVYDDRADRISQNDNGTTTYNHVYSPIFKQPVEAKAETRKKVSSQELQDNRAAFKNGTK